jgi:hypothetical protein
MALYDSPSGPCAAWLDKADLPCTLGAEATDAIKDSAIAAASFVLWALGGRRHGLCSTTIRPCRADVVGALDVAWGEWGTGYHPALISGEWFNICGHKRSCGCTALSEIRLPWGPTGAVSEVKIDGTALATTAYRVDDRRLLVRLDGEAWPACQDLLLDDSEPGTFSITFTHGVPLDDMAPQAAGELACEFVKSRIGGKCRLPERVQTITRQSVTWTLLDPQQFLTEGRTGLYFVDLWLAAVNPTAQPEESHVWSVEDHLRGRARRVDT